MTAPNGPSQSALIYRALVSGGLHPWQIRVVSMHGTGTPLGDPIEVGALGQSIFTKDDRENHHYVIMQSNKASFGHMEGAAGGSSTLSHTCTYNGKVIFRSVLTC